MVVPQCAPSKAHLLAEPGNMAANMFELKAEFDGHDRIDNLPCTRLSVPDGSPVDGFYTGLVLRHGESGPYTVYDYKRRVLTVQGTLPAEPMTIVLSLPEEVRRLFLGKTH